MNRNFLETGEEILWSDIPYNRPYIFNRIIEIFSESSICLLIFPFAYFFEIALNAEVDWFSSILFVIAIFSINVFIAIRKIYELKTKTYFVTNNRLVIYSKFFKEKITFLNRHDITKTTTNNSFFDNKYLTTTIIFNSEIDEEYNDNIRKKQLIFESLNKPEKLLALLENGNNR